jgi:C1A family cysteine protease
MFTQNVGFIMSNAYGWKRDLPDIRDHYFTLAPAQYPQKLDLRIYFPAPYDQGRLGSCTAQAIAGAFDYEWRQHKKGPSFVPSRLFIYYNERWIEGTVNQDSGAYIRDGFKAMNQWGVANETLWPYVISKFAVKPGQNVYADGAQRKTLTHQYARINQDRNTLCSILATNQPIVFGFSVYESYETATVRRTGYVPLPRSNERQLGGHAVLMIGYDTARQVYIFRNSYSSNWGDKGYGYLPFSYVENKNLAADFWILKTL